MILWRWKCPAKSNDNLLLSLWLMSLVHCLPSKKETNDRPMVLARPWQYVYLYNMQLKRVSFLLNNLCTHKPVHSNENQKHKKFIISAMVTQLQPANTASTSIHLTFYIWRICLCRPYIRTCTLPQQRNQKITWKVQNQRILRTSPKVTLKYVQ